MTTPYRAVILGSRKGAAGKRLAPKLVSQKSNRLGWSLGRLLLFIGLNEQGNYTDDDKCVLKQFTVCDHWTAPLYEDQRAEAALRREGQPPTVTGSADLGYHIFRHFAIRDRSQRLHIGSGHMGD